MIIIDNKIISDEVVDTQFVCNLNACKGACCIDGDGGAPLEPSEKKIIEENYAVIEPFLTKEGKAEIAKQGLTIEYEGELEAPLINGKACVYLNYDENGIGKCAFEKAYEAGLTNFLKPVSCHLYPVRVAKVGEHDALNYDHWSICSAACELGKTLQMPLFRFVKDGIVRKYGLDFYEQLEASVKFMQIPNE